MKLYQLQRKCGELEDLKGNWMISEKQLIVADSWTLGLWSEIHLVQYARRKAQNISSVGSCSGYIGMD